MHFAVPFASKIFHRAMKCVLIVAIGAHAAGMPMPVGVWKDLSKPFPCQFRSCGCQSAESCWRSCCCFTDAEKLAWAEENGVTAPQHVHQRVALTAKRKAPVKERRSSCCLVKTGPSAASVESKSCSSASKGCCTSHEKAPTESSKKYEAVSISEYRNCQGLDNGLLKLPPVVVCFPSEVATGFPLCEATVSANRFLTSRPLPPPTPPPECSINSA